VSLPTATSSDVAAQAADIAVLPIGSFEQHGAHLPLTTDTLIASVIAQRIASDYGLLLLPPITIGCSHEHAGWAGSVSVSARTLHQIVCDVADSLAKNGTPKLVLVNAHGGNYVLSNVVQEHNVERRRMVLFPTGDDWRDARTAAGVESTNHEDMHAGEAETSILLATTPDVVRASYTDADHIADDRRHLLTLGMAGYTDTGVIGRPSLASVDKGRRLLDAFADLFKQHLAQLR
jgi:creatinine amidohydrolase